MKEVFTVEQENAMVRHAVESRTFLSGLLAETHERWIENWRLYFAQRDDLRDPVTEKWRAQVHVPQPFYNTEAKVAQELEILMSADPPIQPEAIRPEDQPHEQAISRLLDYTLRINHFRKFLATVLRGVSVQGTEFIKSTWRHTARTVPAYSAAPQLAAWQQQIREAVDAGLPEPPDPTADPQGFERWREAVNKSRRLRQPIGTAPLVGADTTVVKFHGPHFERISPWSVFAHPLVQEMADQPVVIHEVFKPVSWLEARSGEDAARFPFDGNAVRDALASSGAGEAQTDKQIEVAERLGISSVDTSDPQLKSRVKLWEVWRLNSEFPFQVILNEKKVINWDPRKLPFEHASCPLLPIRNVVAPGYLLGVGDYDPARKLFAEQDSLRSLRLDSVTLHTMPVFQRLLGVAIPDLQKRLRPGGFIEVPRMDSIKRLIEGDVNNSAFQEVPMLGLDIDRAFGIGDNVRGAQASIGRVSATESTSRLNQAVLRLKLNALAVEDDLNQAVEQWLGLWAQFGFNSRVEVGGEEPTEGLSRELLLTAFAQRYRFRGATQVVNKELNAQQLIEFGTRFGQQLLPTEMRALMRAVGEVLNLRGLTSIVSEEGTQMVAQQMAQQQAAAQAQAAAQQQQADVQNTAASLPGQVPVEGGMPPGAEGEAPPEGGMQ